MMVKMETIQTLMTILIGKKKAILKIRKLKIKIIKIINIIIIKAIKTKNYCINIQIY